MVSETGFSFIGIHADFPKSLALYYGLSCLTRDRDQTHQPVTCRIPSAALFVDDSDMENSLPVIWRGDCNDSYTCSLASLPFDVSLISELLDEGRPVLVTC